MESAGPTCLMEPNLPGVATFSRHIDRIRPGAATNISAKAMMTTSKASGISVAMTGEHRAVALEHDTHRGGERGNRIAAELLEVLEVGEHDDDRAHEEGRDQGECRNKCATQLVADSLHVAECRRHAASPSGCRRRDPQISFHRGVPALRSRPGGEDLAQLRGEGVRVARLAVLAAEEAAVVAREDHRLRAEALGDGVAAAARHLAVGLDAARRRTMRVGGGAQRVEVGLVVGAGDACSGASSGSLREPSSSAGMPNMAGSGRGLARRTPP